MGKKYENIDELSGPDYEKKEPTPYLYDAPSGEPHVGKHQSGVGGPSDRNYNNVGLMEKEKKN